MSALSKLEKLMYTIGVVDKATAPVNKIMGKIQQMSQHAKGAQDQIMRGFIGAAGGGYAFAKSLLPAIDHVAALGETQSLDVTNKQLNLLTKKGYEFTAVYGGNATEFVRSSYKIQQSIKPVGKELAEISTISNLTAIALKGDANSVSDSFSKIYHSNKKHADSIGKVNFFDQMSGKMAYMQTQFDVNAGTIGAAFSKLGSKATSKGVDINEQLAVIGVLKEFTKSGGAAAGMYEALLDKVNSAGKALNLDFYENGKLIQTDRIVSKINEKLKDATLSQRESVLDKVFGASGRDAIDYLSNKIGKVTEQTRTFANITDSSLTAKMAATIASPWDRLSASFSNVATALGLRLLPVVEPVVTVLSTLFMKAVELTEQFPILSSVLVGLAAGTTLVMIAAGLFNIVMGLSRFGLIGLTGITGIYSKTLGGLKTAYLFAGRQMLAFNMLAASSGGTLAALRTALLIATTSTWAFNAALLANPITWVVGGVILLAAVIYKYWQPIKAFISGFWSGFKEGFSPITSMFTELGGSLSWVGGLFSWIASAVGNVVNWFSELLTPVNSTTQELANVTAAGQGFGKIMGQALNFILIPLKAVISMINFLSDAISSISSGLLSFFGIGDDISVKTNQSIDHVINDKLPKKTADNFKAQTFNYTTGISTPINNVVPTPANNVVPLPLQTNQQLNQASSVNYNAVNYAAGINTPANNVVPLPLQINQQQSTENQLNNTINNKAIERKVEKSSYLQQLSNTQNTNNSTDQSKRVYIDNLTLKSDDINRDFEAMMELAG